MLLHDYDRGKVEKNLSKFMTRPAYAYTSIQQKSAFPKNICNECAYYMEDELNKKVCQFPWFNPQEFDVVVHPYLPCVKEDKHEED